MGTETEQMVKHILISFLGWAETLHFYAAAMWLDDGMNVQVFRAYCSEI